MIKNCSNINLDITLNNGELSTNFSNNQGGSPQPPDTPQVIDYNDLINKPKVNGITLIDNKLANDLELVDLKDEMSLSDINGLF